MITLAPEPAAPTKNQVEELARSYGMVYRDEVLVFQETSPQEGQEPEGPVETLSTETIQVYIPKGSSAEEIGELLQKHGVIVDKAAFLERVINREVSTELEAGDYYFSPDLTLDELIDRLLIPKRGRLHD